MADSVSTSTEELSIGRNTVAIDSPTPTIQQVAVQRRQSTTEDYKYQLRNSRLNSGRLSHVAEQTSQKSLNNGSKSKTDFINSTTEDWFGEMDDESVKNTATSMGSTSSVPNETVIFESKHTDSPSSPRFSGIKVFQDRTGAKHSGVTNPNINPQHNVKHQSTSIISTATKAGVSIPVTAVKDNSNNAIPTTKPQIHQRKTLDNSQRPPASSLSISSATIPTKKEDEWVLVGHDGSQPAEAPVDVEIARLNERIAKIERFRKVLDQPIVDLEQLKKLSWNGIPDELRPQVWRLLMGYLPSNHDRRKQIIAKKRNDYAEYLRQSFNGVEKSSIDQAIYHQIAIDVPRTNPGLKLYQHSRIQKALERILYCWAIRHPASGYVQGINDLATPFFQVFISEYLREEDCDQVRLEKLSDGTLAAIEADTFWCLSKLLDGIQDNYTHAQPGIHRMLSRMRELIGRIDAKLFAHLQSQNIEFIQFAFRWMNCLLMREMSLRNVIRMWDTYLSEGPDGFADFHIYVAAAFLVKWSEHLRKLEFQDIIMFLQSPPTKNWKTKEIEILLSEAFMWKSLFHNSPSHLIASNVKSNNDWSI